MHNQQINTNRNIMFHKPVTSDSCAEIIQRILDINAQDRMFSNEYREMYPIWLFLNTGGGSVHDAAAVCDAILGSKTSIMTVALGRVASAGFPMFLCGEKRFIGHNAFMMTHKMTCAVSGAIADIDISTAQLRQLNRYIEKIITSRCRITQKQLNENTKLKKDWWFNSQECLELGIADEIYSGTY
jgi:ATP-dependent Clp protease protease subunit